MNYEEQRMNLWAKCFLFAEENRNVIYDDSDAYADNCLAKFEKRFAPKTEPLSELTA